MPATGAAALTPARMAAASASSARDATMSAAASTRGVATANTVSPSKLVWTGRIALAMPSWAWTATRCTSTLLSTAFVATRPSVVLPPGGGGPSGGTGSAAAGGGGRGRSRPAPAPPGAPPPRASPGGPGRQGGVDPAGQAHARDHLTVGGDHVAAGVGHRQGAHHQLTHADHRVAEAALHHVVRPGGLAHGGPHARAGVAHPRLARRGGQAGGLALGGAGPGVPVPDGPVEQDRRRHHRGGPAEGGATDAVP